MTKTQFRDSARIVCQFSWGAASAVATKLALAQYGERAVIVNAFVKEEHPDNRRFAADCERRFGREIVNLRDTNYDASAIRVFETVGHIKGRTGAACTTRIKRGLLRQFEKEGDVLVLGYTAEEQWRLDDWMETWPDRPIVAPLIERGLTKQDCKAMVVRAGIALPYMYELGYEAEEKVAQLHGENAYILRYRSGPLKGRRFPLRELPPGEAHRGEPLPSCGLFCEMAEKEYAA